MTGRLRLSDGERKALADIGQKLWKQALKAVAKIVTKPDTMLCWHRKFAAQKFDGSKQRRLWAAPRSTTGWRPWWCVWHKRTARGAMIALWVPLGQSRVHDQ